MINFQNQVIEMAKQFRENLGGTIFSFPIEENNPFSRYAVVIYDNDKFIVFPDAIDISEAASGILAALEEMKNNGLDVDYERNVRMISYQAQMDAPSTIMRRLKKDGYNKPILKEGEDFIEGDEDNKLFSEKGLLKFNYIMIVDENNAKAKLFMDEYYKLLAMRKYGKTVAGIRQEVYKMDKNQASNWLEKTFKKYVNPGEIMSLFSSSIGAII